MDCSDSLFWQNLLLHEALFNSFSKVPKEEKGEQHLPELLKKKKRKVDEGKH